MDTRMINKKDFIERKVVLMCQVCNRKARIVQAMWEKLPDADTLDTMETLFEKIYKEEG